jgi:hypothetical protein
MKSFSQYLEEAAANDLHSKNFVKFSAHVHKEVGAPGKHSWGVGSRDKQYSVHGKPNQSKAKAFADHLKSKGFTHSSSESTHRETGEKITQHAFTHPKTNHKVYMSHGEKGNVREVQTHE